jgi:hypothetical protein
MSLLILKLISAYLLSQLPFRRSKGEKQRSLRLHIEKELVSSSVFLALASLFILPAERGMLPLILLITLLRLVSGGLSSRYCFGSWARLICAEIIQLLVVVGITAKYTDGPALLDQILNLLNTQQTYGLIIAYAVSLGLGSALVPLVTSPLQSSDSKSDSLKGAGFYIGILERLLVTSLIIFWPKLDAAAIGLIFSAKSIARFPEFQKTRFAEYFLIGSLTSFLVAIGAGLLGRFILIHA